MNRSRVRSAKRSSKRDAEFAEGGRSKLAQAFVHAGAGEFVGGAEFVVAEATNGQRGI